MILTELHRRPFLVERTPGSPEAIVLTPLRFIPVAQGSSFAPARVGKVRT